MDETYERVVSEDEKNDIDMEYSTFPEFKEWADLEIDLETWEIWSNRVDRSKDDKPGQVFEAALDSTVRAAAIDTGAIENLYPMNRGITQNVALEIDGWEQEIDNVDENIRRFFEAQSNAYLIVSTAVKEGSSINIGKC